MSTAYSNKAIRIFMVSIGNILGIIFANIVFYICFLMTYYSDQEGAIYFSYMFLALMPVTAIVDWFIYFRYIANYGLVNRGIIISIDPESNTIEAKKSIFSREKVQQISNVTLVMHQNAESEFAIPKNPKEKIINILSDGPKGRFKNLWYIQIKTINGNEYFLTPLMFRLKDQPFEDIAPKYVRKPIIEKLR